MQKHLLPIALTALAFILIGLSVRRWMENGVVDWFSAIVAIITLGLVALMLRQGGAD